jgi:hypothetical protein
MFSRKEKICLFLSVLFVSLGLSYDFESLEQSVFILIGLALFAVFESIN